MTTTAIPVARVAVNGAATTPHLTVVAGDNVTNMGVLVRARNALATVASKIMDGVRAFGGWLSRVLHLEAVGDGAGSLWDGVKNVASTVLNGGLLSTGAGLLALATETGRGILSWLTTPFRWLGRKIAEGWNALRDRLEAKATVTPGIKPSFTESLAGIAYKAMDFVVKVVAWPVVVLAPYFGLNTRTMALARSVGYFTLGAGFLKGMLAVAALGNPLTAIPAIALLIVGLPSLIGAFWDNAVDTFQGFDEVEMTPEEILEAQMANGATGPIVTTKQVPKRQGNQAAKALRLQEAKDAAAAKATADGSASLGAATLGNTPKTGSVVPPTKGPQGPAAAPRK